MILVNESDTIDCCTCQNRAATAEGITIQTHHTRSIQPKIVLTTTHTLLSPFSTAAADSISAFMFFRSGSRRASSQQDDHWKE